MNIFEFAMKMEKDGEAYYRELAEKTTHTGLKNILNLLANEEVKHYEVLNKLSKQESNLKMAETHILVDAKNVFVQMKEQGSTFDLKIPQPEFYEKAREIEEKSYQFYLEKAREVEDESARKVLLKIADEEKKHIFLMENLVEYLSRPGAWVENAEFHKLDEY
jgi:rubrerythrin